MAENVGDVDGLQGVPSIFEHWLLDLFLGVQDQLLGDGHNVGEGQVADRAGLFDEGNHHLDFVDALSDGPRLWRPPVRPLVGGVVLCGLPGRDLLL